MSFPVRYWRIRRWQVRSTNVNLLAFRHSWQGIDSAFCNEQADSKRILHLQNETDLIRRYGVKSKLLRVTCFLGFATYFSISGLLHMSCGLSAMKPIAQLSASS